MKKTLTFVSMLALAACSGGDGGSLHPTHGTSTGGASNQPAYYANFKQYFDNVIKTGADGGTYTNFVEGGPIWPSLFGKGYKHYEYKEHTYTPGNGQTITQHTVDEKEMQLANYGIHVTMPNDTNHLPDTINPYVHNREGVAANLYAPASGTTFTGDTFAYLNGGSTWGQTVIHGDATYTYNSSAGSELVLDFDNYYTFDVVLANGNNGTVTVSGTNNAGVNFNVPTGTHGVNGTVANFAITHLHQGDIQEAVGTYEMQFGDGNIGNSMTHDFTMHGAFGGTHE